MAELNAVGSLRKMSTSLMGEGDTSQAHYEFIIGDERIPFNQMLGKAVKIAYQGAIHCQHCGRKSNKSFNQGYCYPCFKKLAQCDSCIVSPEKCHYFEGTCREPSWADSHCMQSHYVYLANSTGVKVGITRGNQIPTRWIDQGAVQALPIFKVANRLQSGLLEVIFKAHVADKTSWQKMLKGNIEAVDLMAARDELLTLNHDAIAGLQAKQGIQALQSINDAAVVTIDYPVDQYPTKVKSFNLDKTPVVEGQLMGIKGQYLILDSGVINIRKYTGYDVELTVS